jgi:Zn-dependent protease with chaperone function
MNYTSHYAFPAQAGGIRKGFALLLICQLLAGQAWAERTALKPGWNMFSPQQDIEIGQQNAAEAEKQLPMLRDAEVDRYVDSLGKQLAARAPGEKYPYQFKTINDKSINAFALPGGFIYINRGVIEAADNEAQLAGVIAHEISHVALRHGTNQASKAAAAQAPLAILGGLLGSNSAGAVLAQLGAGFALNSILLKYSRDAETQADVMGTQILYDSGYQPAAMGIFFQKLQAEGGGGRPLEFFSNHPNPDNRMGRVNEEVSKLGGNPQGSKATSSQFEEVKRRVQSLPAAPKTPQQTGSAAPADQGGPVPRPSDRFTTFQNSFLQMSYPDNWKAYPQGDAVSIVPPGGVVSDAQGNQALAYGAIVNQFSPRGTRITLEDATEQLVTEFRQSNPSMRVLRNPEAFGLNGQRALSTYLRGDSPRQGREVNWLVTVAQPEGILYFVFTAPESEFQSYERTYEQMIYSVRFR